MAAEPSGEKAHIPVANAADARACVAGAPAPVSFDMAAPAFGADPEVRQRRFHAIAFILRRSGIGWTSRSGGSSASASFAGAAGAG
jgi:hypothetical protein